MLQFHIMAKFCNADAFLKGQFLPRAPEDIAHNFFSFSAFKSNIFLKKSCKLSLKLNPQTQNWKLVKTFELNIFKGQSWSAKMFGLGRTQQLFKSVDR